MILEDFQWHTWPCPITVSKQFNLYKGRPATSDTSPLSFKLKLPPALLLLLRLHFVPNPNYVASNPGGIPKSQISLRPTPTTTAGADNLTLLSFISLCGQTGTNYSRAPFSPTHFSPFSPPPCQLLSHHWHQSRKHHIKYEITQIHKYTNTQIRKYSLVMRRRAKCPLFLFPSAQFPNGSATDPQHSK